MVTKGYGITVADIDDSCPNDLKPYELAHNQELIEQDQMNYFSGLYTLSAFSKVMASVFGKNAPYPKEPLFGQLQSKPKNVGEGNEEIAVFEMKQRSRMLTDMGLPGSPH